MKKVLWIPALVFTLALAFGVFAPCKGASAAADTYKLVFACHGNSTHAYYPAIERWAAALKEESGGRLNIEMHWGGTLASATDEVPLVQQGGADLTWSTTSLNASLFRYPGILGAYGAQVTNTYIGTYAMIEMLRNVDAISNEFKNAGLRPLAYHAQTPSSIGGRGKKVVTPADFKGLSVQSISRNCINILDSFGAAVIGVAPPMLYENVSKNVCSASMVDSALFSETRLYEVIEWFNTFNYNSSIGFMVMNQEKFDSLPADLQQLLDSKFEELSYAISKDTNDYFVNFVEKTLPENKVEIYGTTPEMIAAINTTVENVLVKPYRELCEEGGYNADAIIAAMEKALADGRAKYGPEYDWFKSLKN